MKLLKDYESSSLTLKRVREVIDRAMPSARRQRPSLRLSGRAMNKKNTEQRRNEK